MVKIDENSQDEATHVVPIHEDSSGRFRTPSFNRTLSAGIVLQPPIPEEETSENNENNNQTRRTSFVKKTSRSNSVSKVKAKIVELKDNHSFQRGYLDSARSSQHSLPVQREQYWCFSKWSPFERRLAASVALLAIIIVALVITVGFLADRERNDQVFGLRL